MRHLGALLVALLGPAGCGRPSVAGSHPAAAEAVIVAERFVDAFYSFERSRLARALSSAGTSAPRLLYYQGWAEGGHYRVLQREPCELESAGTVRCAVTVEDDLITALGLAVQVTDTFRITVADGEVRHVATTSNDPPLFDEAFAWVRHERADRVHVPCEGFFAGGPTPEACVRAIVQGFTEFAAHRRPDARAPHVPG